MLDFGRGVLAGGMLLVLAGGSRLRTAEAGPAGEGRRQEKTLRLLAVGNSFSHNATEYLPGIVLSQKSRLVLVHAAIGGSSMEKHWSLAEIHEANPEDPEGMPYEWRLPDGTRKKVGLKECLKDQAWDIVTIQQHSWTSADVKTFRPYAQKLADYVRRHAPGAELWMQETWAYRPDHPMLKKAGMTPGQMYQQLRGAYATIAAEIKASRIIPTGTAFQNAREDPRWKLEVQADFDPRQAKYPEEPRESHALCLGWWWNKKADPPRLEYDGKHCTVAGKYLGAMVWYETLFGDARGDVFVPEGLPPQEASSLREIAHKTVREGLRPRGLAPRE